MFSETRMRLTALGCAMFIVAVIPVLPLTTHYYDYYIGVAALGIAIAVVGLGELVPRYPGGVAALIAAGILVVDAATCDRAARDSEVLREVLRGQEISAEVMKSLHATRALVGPEREIVLPRAPVTDYMIDVGHAEVVFLHDRRITVVGGRTHAVEAGSPPAPAIRADRLESPFWQNAQLDSVRVAAYHLHSAYLWLLSWC